MVVLESPAYLQIPGRFPRVGAHMKCVFQTNVISVPGTISLQLNTHVSGGPNAGMAFQSVARPSSSNVPGTQVESQNLEEPVPQPVVCGHSSSSKAGK